VKLIRERSSREKVVVDDRERRLLRQPRTDEQGLTAADPVARERSAVAIDNAPLEQSEERR
jgi:hypothetical protein